MHPEFHSTRWSLVVAAGQGSTLHSKRALASLCETYWYPLYSYVRRRVPNVEEAHDLTQAFFAELLEKDYIAAAVPERGKFRAFLLTAFKHFLSKQWEMQRALKRGGGRLPISLDFNEADSNIRIEPPDSGLTPEQAYDREWAIALLNLILGRLEEELKSSNKGEQFAALKGFIIGDHSETTYTQVALELNMTEAAAKKSASRMRARYRELLREEISQTVNAPSDVDDEIRDLFATLTL